MNELLRRAWDLDPSVLVDAARLLPGWAAWALALLGLGYAFFGAHHALLRGTVAALGALVGWVAVDVVVRPEALGVTPLALSWAGACALAILGGVWPVAAGFVVWGIAGALFFQRWIPLDDPFLRILPGGLVGGALGGLFVRAVASLASSFVGAAVAAVGIAAVLLQRGHADWLDPHPVVTLLPFSLAFVSGAAVQLTRRPPPREAGQMAARAERLPDGGAI